MEQVSVPVLSITNSVESTSSGIHSFSGVVLAGYPRAL